MGKIESGSISCGIPECCWGCHNGLMERHRQLERFLIFSEVGPSEPWFGAMVGLFFLSALIATFWLLFRNPTHRGDRNRPPRDV
jgi:hypothetical protein